MNPYRNQYPYDYSSVGALTNFYTSLSQCPPNPAVRAIVFQDHNLAVIDGPDTEITIDLSHIFIPVENAAKGIFTLLPKVSGLPHIVNKLDLAGVDLGTGLVKFIALLPNYGTGATSSSVKHIEWATVKDIEDGTLDELPAYAAGATTNFAFWEVNQMQYNYGGYLGYSGGTGSMWLATNGGLMKWDGTDCKLWNTLNSYSPSDYMTSIAVDSSQTIWIGSNKGLLQFNESQGFVNNWNTDNSSISSNNVKDVKIVDTYTIGMATDVGLSLYNYNSKEWKTFNIYNNTTIDTNDFRKIVVNNDTYTDPVIYSATDNGVFVYHVGASSWSGPFNSSNITGWTAPDSVQSIEQLGGIVYAGTTAGLVIFNPTGLTGHTIAATGANLPISTNFTSLRIVNYPLPELYAGHNSAWSVYDIDGDQWYNYGNQTLFPSMPSGSIKDILVDFRSGSTAGKSLFFGCTSGPFKIHTNGPLFDLFPGTINNANLLMSFPLGTQSYHPSGFVNPLCPVNQPLYFMFSKNMLPTGSTHSPFESNVDLKYGSYSILGSWEWSSSGKLGTFTPTTPLAKASKYNITITAGTTANDGTYLKETANFDFYTEDIVPETGWNPIGDIMVLSGNIGEYTGGLYLRNPQANAVIVTTLIGK